MAYRPTMFNTKDWIGHSILTSPTNADEVPNQFDDASDEGNKQLENANDEGEAGLNVMPTNQKRMMDSQALVGKTVAVWSANTTNTTTIIAEENGAARPAKRPRKTLGDGDYSFESLMDQACDFMAQTEDKGKVSNETTQVHGEVAVVTTPTTEEEWGLLWEACHHQKLQNRKMHNTIGWNWEHIAEHMAGAGGPRRTVAEMKELWKTLKKIKGSPPGSPARLSGLGRGSSSSVLSPLDGVQNKEATLTHEAKVITAEESSVASPESAEGKDKKQDNRMPQEPSPRSDFDGDKKSTHDTEMLEEDCAVEKVSATQTIPPQCLDPGRSTATVAISEVEYVQMNQAISKPGSVADKESMDETNKIEEENRFVAPLGIGTNTAVSNKKPAAGEMPRVDYAKGGLTQAISTCPGKTATSMTALGCAVGKDKKQDAHMLETKVTEEDGFKVPAARATRPSSPGLETTATSTSTSEVKCAECKDSKQDPHIPNTTKECSKVAPMFAAATITEGAPAGTDHEKEDTPLSQASEECEECTEMAPALTNQQPESPKLPTGGAGLSDGAKNSGAVQVQDKGCAMVAPTKTSNGLGFGLQTITPATGLLSPTPDQNTEAKDRRDILMSEDCSLVTPTEASPSRPSLDLQTTPAEASGALAKDQGQETEVFKHATPETMAATPALLYEAGGPLEQKKDHQEALKKQNVRATKVTAKAMIPAPPIDVPDEGPVNKNGPASLSEAGRPLEKKKEDQEALEKQNVHATKVTAKIMIPAPPIDVSGEVPVSNNGAIVRASLPHQPLSNAKVEDGPRRARKRPARSRPSADRTMSSRGSRRRNNAIVCGLCSKKIDEKMWALHKNEVIQTQIREHVVCMKCWPITKPSKLTPPPLPRGLDGHHRYQMASKVEYFRYSPGWKPFWAETIL